MIPVIDDTDIRLSVRKMVRCAGIDCYRMFDENEDLDAVQLTDGRWIEGACIDKLFEPLQQKSAEQPFKSPRKKHEAHRKYSKL